MLTFASDSLRCIQVIAGVLGRAGEEGQRRRLEDAKNGHVTWETPVDIIEAVELSKEAAAAAAEKLQEI